MEKTTVSTITKFHIDSQQKKMKSTKLNCKEISSKIDAMAIGESCVYMTQDASWQWDREAQAIIKMFEVLKKQGGYTFTQRLVERKISGIGVYDYIIKRLY